MTLVCAEAAQMSTDAIEYCVNGGRLHAGGTTEQQRCLTINAADRTTKYEKFRSSSDEPGAVIGLFRSALQAEELRRLMELARSLDIGKMPTGTAGGPGISVMSIRLLLDGQLARVQFSSMDIAHIQRLEPLIDKLEATAISAERFPEAAGKLVVAPQQRPGSEQRFEFALTNIGREPICFGDPRALSVNDPDLQAAVAVAFYPPDKPGFTAPPLKWKKLALDQAGMASPTVQLPPGATFRAESLPWKSDQPGRHLVQASWSDYRALTVAKCHNLRGALFSQGLEVTAK